MPTRLIHPYACRYKYLELEKRLRTSNATLLAQKKDLQALQLSNTRYKIALEEAHGIVDEWRDQVLKWKTEADEVRTQMAELQAARADNAMVRDKHLQVPPSCSWLMLSPRQNRHLKKWRCCKPTLKRPARTPPAGRDRCVLHNYCLALPSS